MTRWRAMSVLAGAITLAAALAAAPAPAQASCAGRKMTGTVVGGVGGALVGNAVARGGAGAFLGGLGGAVLGHEVAASGCRGARRGYHPRRRAAYGPGPGADGGPGPMRPVRTVYYDQYGRPVAQDPPAGYAQTAAQAAAPGAGGDCRTETRAFYDDRGLLVSRPVQVCAP